MRWLSSAICTSGEPVSPSVVAYSAMIFFLVSASVPIDIRGSFRSRCAARRGLFTRALDSAAVIRRVARPRSGRGNRGRLPTSHRAAKSRSAPATPRPRVLGVDASVEGDVQISEVDPLDPVNEPVLHAMWDVSAAARADRPFEVWAPWTTAYATWTTAREDQDDVMWAARVGGVVVGMAWLVMSHVDNQHVATTELFVHPDHRRRGIGAALLSVVVDRSRAAGRTVLMTSPYSPVDRPGAGEEFLTAHGFELGIAEMSRVCDLEESEHTWPELAAQIAPQHAGYRLEAWQDRIPEPFVEGYCRLGEAFNDEAPLGDLDLGAEVWSAERVAERDARFLATGRRQFGVLAYAADGTCVATTELFVNQVASWRA